VQADPPEPYLAALAQGIHTSVDVAPYVGLLDVAAADLRLTATERRELRALASDLGLDDRAVARAHREFLNGLIDGAVEDSVVTDDEHDQLCRAAALLDIDIEHIARRTDSFRRAPRPSN
jgi:DNA polymerase III subunit epsilon